MDVTPELIERIAQMVADALGTDSAAAPAVEAPAVLAIGSGAAALVPPTCRVASIEEYAGSCAAYAAVVVGEMSCALLADVALGRDASKGACAVMHALLEGVPVYVLAEGFAHRAYRATANPRLYAQLEGYVEHLSHLGARVMGAPALAAALAAQIGSAQKGAAPEAPEARPVADVEGFLSAAGAQDLVRSGATRLSVAPGAVVTPLARDVLREHGVTLEYIGRS